MHSPDVKALESRRMWIIDQLAALIRNPSVPKSDEWIKSILDWLIVHGLFEVKKSSKSPFDAVRMPYVLFLWYRFISYKSYAQYHGLLCPKNFVEVAAAAC